MMKQDFLVIEISHICPTCPEQNDRSSQKQHALKGQKLLAQGNALGIKAFSKAPCFTLIEQALSVFFNVNYI